MKSLSIITREGTPSLRCLGHQQYEACTRNIVLNPLAIERLASHPPDDKHFMKLSDFIRERASGLEANREELLVPVLDFSIQQEQEAEYRQIDEMRQTFLERKKSMRLEEQQGHIQELEIKKNTLQQQRKILLEKIQNEFPRYVYLKKNSYRLSEEDLELIEEAKRYRHPEIHAQTGRLNKLKSELHSSKCELFDAIQQQNLTKLELSVF